MRGLFVWLAISGFAFVANLLVCGEELAAQDGTFFDKVLSLIGFSACDGIPGWVDFVLSLLIVIPGLFFLFGLIGPIVAGMAANSVSGVAISAALVLLFLTVLVLLLGGGV